MARTDETDRKLELTAELIRASGGHRKRNGAWGEVTVRMRWEGGVLKEVKFVEENIIRDSVQFATKPLTVAAEAS